jgi:aminoglycoside N3'-acetyltransferase
MNKISKIKGQCFPKGIKRGLTNYKNRLFSRTTERKLVSAISELGIDEGSVICIHSMLSGLGYIEGGPETVINSVLKAVPGSTIIMPTFPFAGTTETYLSSEPVYCMDETPSKSGLLTETFRLYPGSKRSYHPTHPCTALGPKADYLIDGSEDSGTPFGDESSYGRYCNMDEAVQLLIHTNSSSIVHRVQEIVNIPNLFYDKPINAKGVGRDANIKNYPIKVHTPSIPLFWIVPGDDEHSIEYIWSPDYAYLFPEYNRSRIMNNLKSKNGKSILLDRHRYFTENQIYKNTKIDDAEIVAVKVKPWLERICSDLKESIDTYTKYYSMENMAKALREGLLTK